MSISVEFQKRFTELVDELECSTKTAAAEKLGITYVIFSKSYNYGIIPKPKVLIRMADCFNVSIEYLLGRTDDERFDKSEKPTTFIERLTKLRESKNLTVYGLAKETHIHKNNISEWVHKDYIPNWDDLFLLADYFEVSLDYLLGRTDDDNPN